MTTVCCSHLATVSAWIVQTPSRNLGLPPRFFLWPVYCRLIESRRQFGLLWTAPSGASGVPSRSSAKKPSSGDCARVPRPLAVHSGDREGTSGATGLTEGRPQQCEDTTKLLYVHYSFWPSASASCMSWPRLLLTPNL